MSACPHPDRLGKSSRCVRSTGVTSSSSNWYHWPFSTRDATTCPSSMLSPKWYTRAFTWKSRGPADDTNGPRSTVSPTEICVRSLPTVVPEDQKRLKWRTT
jgi:hypothetical protein